ncbi:MAG: riboflavin synthase, partial [Desulfobacterales bacterium]
RFSDRLDGHLVAGHIDGVGTLKAIGTKANATILTIGVDAALARYMIEKGSVAVDGISLTVNRCTSDRFEVSIIPHTAVATTLRLKKVGAAVNIEVDMIGKYVERFLTGASAPGAARRNVE